MGLNLSTAFDDRVAPASDDETPADQVRAYLSALIAAPSFTASARRRRLLAYLVEQTLAGNSDHLKPYDIARAVLGRDEGFDPVNDPIVRIEVGRLRRDLETHYMGGGSRDPLRIEIGKGHYVAHFFRAAPPDLPAPPVAYPARMRLWRKGWLALAAMLVIALVASWPVYRLVRPEPSIQAEGPAVVVQPFETLAGGEEGQLLAAGLSQGLVTGLMRFDGLQVFSSEDPARPLADPPVSPGVPVYLVSGAVQREAERVRVKAILTDRPSGRVLWSEAYDRSLTPDNLFEVEDSLSAAIVERLASIYGVIGQTTAHRLEQSRPASLFAYDCIQRAFDYRRTFDGARFPSVRDCLDETLRREPEYATAWAMRAFAHMDAARFGHVAPQAAPAELAAGLAAAERSVELAPESPRSLQALAALQFTNGLPDAAETMQRRAIALNPNDPESLAQLGWRLVAVGRYEEGVDLLQDAIARSLIVPNWYYVTLAAGLYFEGQLQAAYETALRGAGPCCGAGYALLAITASALGKDAEASRAVAEAVRQAPVLATEQHAFWAQRGLSEEVISGLMAGMRKAGVAMPPPPIGDVSGPASSG